MNNDRQGADILRALFGKIKETYTNVGQASANLNQQVGSAIEEPMRQLMNLLGTASTSGPQDIRGAGSRGIDFLDDATRKELVKIRKEKVREASDAGIPDVEIAKTSIEMPNIGETIPDPMASKPEAGAGQTGTTPPKTQPKQPQQQNNQGTDILKQLMSFVSSGGGVDKQGVAQPGKLLGGLFQEPPKSVLARQQAQALTPQAKADEALMDNFAEAYKQDRLDAREVLKADLKATGVTDGSATIAGGVSDLISAWQDITFKGRLGGPVGNILGFAGFQRGERDQFKSFATGLAFSFGEHVLGQKGRAFTDNERKEITKNIIGATTSQTDGQFESKMTAIIKQVNNRIPEGGEKVPDYATIVKMLKQNKKTSTSSSQQQPSNAQQQILLNIEAEKKRRGLK